MQKNAIRSYTTILLLGFTLMIILNTFPIVTGAFMSLDDADSEEAMIRTNRRFPECKCIQNLRSNYLTSNVCGQAAMCYWEIWNYNKIKAEKKNLPYNETCDRYMVQKYACLIGYPRPQFPEPSCHNGIEVCDKALSTLLYEECEPIRKSRGLPKPQDVDPRVRLEGLNYDLLQDENTMFQAKPSSNRPVSNNYYILSCPVIYRFPYFTIDLLLNELDPEIVYDETMSIEAVGEMLPKYVRDGINNERIQNFDALSLDHTMLHWCGIPRNYMCIREELDKMGNICSNQKLGPIQAICQ